MRQTAMQELISELEELKKIHDVACSTWQGKITALANRNPFGDSVELTQHEIDEMFKAADSKQKIVLEEVFGKQNVEINLISESLEHTVDGIPVFGVASSLVSDALIGLPRDKGDKNKFFLNPKYKWELVGTRLIITRK